MNICICGGGHEGHALLGALSMNSSLNIVMITRNSSKWDEKLIIRDTDGSEQPVAIQTASYTDAKCISNADLILISTPSFAYSDILHAIAPNIKAGTYIGSIPGTGGFEFLARNILGPDTVLFGSQRVPYISRIIQYGHSVHISGRRPEMRFAVLPQEMTGKLAPILEAVFKVQTMMLHSYLEVTLTPSNPILRTSRLYSMFKKYTPGKIYDKELLFYENWDIDSSAVLLECDTELQHVCTKLPFDMSGILSLMEHYESSGTDSLTAKIRSIPAFKGLKTPMLPAGNGWIPDFGSRYFTEDIPYGLVIVKAIAALTGSATPAIDRVLAWSQTHLGREYITSDGMLQGKDLAGLPIPQNYGITTLEALAAFYR